MPTPSGSASPTGSSFVEAMLPPDAGELDLIVANLPYVAEREWASLEPEVTKWEPREALLAGPDGLDTIRAAIPVAAAAAPVAGARGRRGPGRRR